MSARKNENKISVAVITVIVLTFRLPRSDKRLRSLLLRAKQASRGELLYACYAILIYSGAGTDES